MPAMPPPESAPAPEPPSPAAAAAVASDAPLVDVSLEDPDDPHGRLTVVPQDEVVRLDLSELPDAEAEAILSVLGKDSVFRADEKTRIDKIEAEVHEESERRRRREQQTRDAQRACARCRRPFRLLFNKRLVCQLCAAGVCRRCATYEAGRKGWLCSACQRERELQANKWLSDIQLRHRVSIRTPGSRLSDSEDDSGYDPSVTHDDPHLTPAAGTAAATDPRRVTAEVRGHLEAVVETLLGESVQNASIRPPSAADSALYDEFHPRLVAAIDKLTQSLCMTLQNRPLDESYSPTTTLAELKSVLQQAEEASMRLPMRDEQLGSGQVTPAEARDTLTSPDGCGEEPNSHTYEEILATAVLSRLAEKARRAAAASFCDAAVQSDDVTPEPCDVTPEPCDVMECAVREVVRPVQSEAPLPGRREQPESSDTEERLSDVTGGVLEITIEEEIEEIITYGDDGDSASGGERSAAGSEAEEEEERGSRRTSVTSSLASTLRSGGSSRDLSGDDVSLPGPSISYSDLTFGGGKSVPFPELGRSLTEVSPLDDGDAEEVGDGTSWEENWLFRRRRLTQPNRLLGEEPVPMLVPHPSEPTAITVGARDVDELSELSERGSQSSLDDWTAAAADSPPQDVTERLRAARDADRDRYLTAAARATGSPRRGSADPIEPPATASELRRFSADASVARSAHPAVATSSATATAAPGTTSAAVGTAALVSGVSSSEASLSRAISWSSVPSDVEQAFSAVSARLAASSPPPPADTRPAASTGAGAADSTPAPPGTASSAAKRPLSAAVRTVPGAAAERTASSSPAEALSRPPARARLREDTSSASSPQRPILSRTAPPPGVGTELMTQAGNIAQFRCRVPATDGAETHWVRDGTALAADERHEMYRVRDQHHLLVYGVTRRDAGRYSCLVVAADGTETWHNFTLRVLGAARPPQPPRFSVAPESTLSPVDGAALRLAVRLIGHPEPRVTFLRGDRPLQHSDTVRIERHSGGEWVLVVQPVRPQDSGPYSVRADSSAGTATRPFTVHVQPPPDVTAAPLPPTSPPPLRHAARQRTAHPAPAGSLVSPSVTSPSSSPMTSPPSYVTSRDEALKETSLTEACNSVILRARPARVRSPADGGRDSEEESDAGGDQEQEEDVCLPPAPPGTIAEREHRKWANAVAMPNNPYTLERVKQRRRSRPLDHTGYYPTGHYSSGEDVSDHDLISTDPSNKIDCGLKSINSERYRRDYYINASARSRWAPPPTSSGRRQAGGGGGSSRPVSALSEEPLPPLSVRGSTDDLGSAGAGSVYHSTESLAVTERISSVSPVASVGSGGVGVGDGGSVSGGSTTPRRPSTRASAASPAVAEDELPPEGTVRSAVQRMQQLSRSAEELAGRRPVHTPPADGRSTVSASPSVPLTATPEPRHQEPETGEQPRDQEEQETRQESRRSPLYVQVEEEEQEQDDVTDQPLATPRSSSGGDGGMEQRPSPDGRESLASPAAADLPPQLPSVKELRSHFQAGAQTQPPQPQKQESPLCNSSVLIIEKADVDSEAWDEPKELRKVEKLRKKTSNHKVHSLTARSVSREFREGLKLGAPLSLHTGNIRDPTLLSGRRPSGGGATDCGLQQRDEQQQLSEEGEVELAASLRLVSSRAAFWDRKVAQELS